MKGRWWRWLSALLAMLCGLAFGWVAGTGVARAEDDRGATGKHEVSATAVPAAVQTCAENHSSRRFQPSSASSLRKLGR